MKKKLLIATSVLFCLIVTTVLTGCGAPYDYEDLSQYITVGEYKGLEYDKSKLEVTDSEVQSKIKEEVKDTTEEEKITEGTVANGDTVIIDYEGTMDGEALKGGSNKDYELKIGSKSLIEGFETGLIGKEIGDTVTLDLTFPENYSNKDLASKPVQFEVTIKSAKVTHEHEYNLDWVKTYSNCNSIEEFEKQVKDNILEEKTANLGITLIKNLAESAEVKEYPEKEIAIATDTMKQKAQKEAEQQKITLSEWYTKMGVANDEEFAKGIRETTEKMVKEQLVAYYIAQKENLVATSQDVTDYYNSYLKKYAVTEEHFEKTNGMSVEDYKNQNMDKLRISMTEKNVAEFLIKNGKAK